MTLIEEAATAGVSGLIFDINSSGASPQQALQFAEQVARLQLRTVAYVNSAAVSGSALLALACDEIYMAPGSRVGAAPPDLSTSGTLSETAQKNLLAQSMAILKAGARGLSSLKGHRSDVAEAFIDAALEVSVGDLKLSAKDELLLLDSAQAVAIASDGKPILAVGISADLRALAKAAFKQDAAPERLGQRVVKKETPDSPDEGETPSEGKTASQPKRQGEFTGKVVRIPVGEQDLIARARFEFMTRTLERCTEEGAEAVIFDLDTPGGLAWDTTNLMMRDLQKLGPPSYAFVNPRALSAGAMIAVATDGIYMAPAGSAGAATPIYGGGGEMGDAERAKMNSAIMGMARTVAKEKGHDPRVIEAMIDMDRELVVNGQVLCAKGEILTLDAEEATLISDGRPLFAKAIATSIDEIKLAEGLTGETVTAEPVGFEIIAIWVTKYASLLILVGIAGAYLEMQAPGFGLPGFISLIAFSLFFFGHYVAGSLVGYETGAAVVIFVIGIVLLVVEFFVLPGTLVPGIVGFLCVIGALIFTMSGWEMPIAPETVEDGAKEVSRTFSIGLAQYATGFRNVLIGVGGAAILLIALARYLPEFGPFKRLNLTATAGGTAEESPAVVQTKLIHIGDTGITRSALRPYGSVEINHLQVEAMVDGGYLQSGVPIRVREIAGIRIVVEPLVEPMV